MTAPDLSRCLLCGGQAVAFSYITEGAVRCQDCGCNITRRHDRFGETGYEEAIAAWNRRDPAVILAAALELPEVKALIRAAQDAEYDLHEWVQCAEWLGKAGFNMDGTPEVLNALSRALAAFSAAALKPDAKGGA
jgi:hypothetical protein